MTIIFSSFQWTEDLKWHLLHISPVLGGLVACHTVHRLHCCLKFCQLQKIFGECARKLFILYLLGKPSNIFIDCQFCVDKDAWSLEIFFYFYAFPRKWNKIRSLVILLSFVPEQTVVMIFCTWTVVRKAAPTSGSLSALLFPWREMWVKITCLFGAISRSNVNLDDTRIPHHYIWPVHISLQD